MAKVPLNFREHPESEMILRAHQFRDELHSRRSVRDFSNRAIPPGILESCLEAAVTAPNGAIYNRGTFRSFGTLKSKKSFAWLLKMKNGSFINHVRQTSGWRP
jgi:iodotyrosine deiodinase